MPPLREYPPLLPLFPAIELINFDYEFPIYNCCNTAIKTLHKSVLNLFIELVYGIIRSFIYHEQSGSLLNLMGMTLQYLVLSSVVFLLLVHRVFE